jgi:hypothetical protein
MLAWIAGFFFFVLVLHLFVVRSDRRKLQKATPEEREAQETIEKWEQQQARERMEKASFGALHPEVICPHCQHKRGVRMKKKTAKKGISGGKAVGGIVTGGASLLLTGISRHEGFTEARCKNCKTQWGI